MAPVIIKMRSVVLGGAALAFSELATTPTLAFMMEQSEVDQKPKQDEHQPKKQPKDIQKLMKQTEYDESGGLLEIAEENEDSDREENPTRSPGRTFEFDSEARRRCDAAVRDALFQKLFIEEYCQHILKYLDHLRNGKDEEARKLKELELIFTWLPDNSFDEIVAKIKAPVIWKDFLETNPTPTKQQFDKLIQDKEAGVQRELNRLWKKLFVIGEIMELLVSGSKWQSTGYKKILVQKRDGKVQQQLFLKFEDKDHEFCAQDEFKRDARTGVSLQILENVLAALVEEKTQEGKKNKNMYLQMDVDKLKKEKKNKNNENEEDLQMDVDIK